MFLLNCSRVFVCKGTLVAGILNTEEMQKSKDILSRLNGSYQEHCYRLKL